MPAAAPIISAVVANNLKGAIIRFALSLAVSYLTQKLFSPETPGQDSNAGSAKDPGVKQRIPSDPSNKLPVVYGEDKVHGSIIFADISSDNQTMAFIIALCEGPIHEIGTVSWDDYDLTLDLYGNVTNATHADGGTDGWLNNNLKIIKYENGGRCTQMETFSSKWASGAQNRSMPDVAYVYCELKYDRENNVTGLTSKLGFQLKGKIIRELTQSELIGVAPSTQTGIGLTNNAIFDDNIQFNNFTGRQLGSYFSGTYGADFPFADGHDYVVPNGTYNIIDLGDVSNGVTLAQYQAGTASASGSGSGGEVEFEFVPIGELHSNHSGGTLRYTVTAASPYTLNGVTYPDNGKRLINGLNIKQWGNNYSYSVAGSNFNTYRVFIEYVYNDIFGVTHKEYYPLTTWEIFPTSAAFSSFTLANYSDRIITTLESSPFTGNFHQSSSVPTQYLPNTYGARRPRINPNTDAEYSSNTTPDDLGVAPDWPYKDHQQYFTAPLPGLIKHRLRGRYSSNPAECLADYLTNKVYGCGLSISDSDLDLSEFYNHKGFCDDIVTHNDPDNQSVTSKRYECNGYVNTNDTKDLTISDITMNSQAIFAYTLGKFQMKSDTTGSVVEPRGVTYTKNYYDEESIYGDFTVVNDGFNSTLNEINLNFKSKLNKFQDDQVFLNYGAKYFNEPILSKDINLKFINSNVEAQRLGTVLMNKSRNNKIVSFRTDAKSRHLQVNDIIKVNGTYYNLSDAGISKNIYTLNGSGVTPDTSPQPVWEIKDDGELNDVPVTYEDGTLAKIYIPRNLAFIGGTGHGNRIFRFLTDCIYGQFINNEGQLTVEQARVNNKLGELLSFITFTEDGSTINGEFYWYWKKLSKHGRGDQSAIESANWSKLYVHGLEQEENGILGTKTYIQSQNNDGTDFKINSISETELEGGLGGFFITAQEYNAADYTVGTLTARPAAPSSTGSHTYSTVGVVSNLVLNNTYPNASVPYVDISFDIPITGNTEGVEIYYAGSATANEADRILTAVFTSSTGSYVAGSTQNYNVQGIPTTADLYIWIRCNNLISRGDFSTALSVGSWSPVNASTNVGDDSVDADSIQDGAVGEDALSNTLDLTSKTITLPADAVKAHTGTWDNTIKTADFSVVNQAYWLGYFIDTTSNTVTITLPATPDDGDIIKLIDVGANAATNNIIINGNSNNIQGSSSNYNINTNRSGTEFIFLTGNGWILTNN